MAKAYSEVKPLQQPHIPLYFGGASDSATSSGPSTATCTCSGESRSRRSGRASPTVRAAAAEWGAPRASASRCVRSSRPPRRKPGSKARRDPREGDREARRPRAPDIPRPWDRSAWSSFAREADVHDKRLWTPIAGAVGGAGNTTALVGTPEQVAEALLDYYDLGVTTLLIRGFDPLHDAVEYGRELIPLVRREVARRDRAAA